MADFREQLLCCAGVDPARIVEFSCGECAGLAGRAQQLQGLQFAFNTLLSALKATWHLFYKSGQQMGCVSSLSL